MSSQRATFFLAGAVLVGCAALLSRTSHLFGYDVDVADMPVYTFVGLHMLASAVFLLVAMKILPALAARPLSVTVLTFIVLAGLIMRLVMFSSQPVLENDYNRYLWDGAVTAHGFNPWASTPQEVMRATADNRELQALRQDAGIVLRRINYADLRTIYPPAAQAAFALAHLIKPYSLDAWRLVLLCLDLAILGLIATLLRQTGQPLVWMTVYWWNPPVIKEVMNSAHMEPVVVVPVLVAVILALRRAWIAAAIAAGVAIAAKIWPILLLPALLRPALDRPVMAGMAALTCAAVAAILHWPMLQTGLGSDSGLVAFSTSWERISASFVILQTLAGLLTPSAFDAGLAARLAAGALAVTAVVWVNRTSPAEPASLGARVLFGAACMLLLSPVQLPWYFVPLAALLCLHRINGLLLMTVTFPLYYAFFKLTATGAAEPVLAGLMWAMWLPVWIVLAFDLRSFAKARSNQATVQ